MEEGLGAGFWLKLIGLLILGGIAVMIMFLFVGAAWARWGGIGAIIICFAVIGFIAWLFDRRKVKQYEEDMAA